MTLIFSVSEENSNKVYKDILYEMHESFKMKKILNINIQIKILFS